MLIRVVHPEPHATISCALTPPDEEGGIMVDASMLEQVQAHGWRIAHKEPVGTYTPPAPSTEEEKPRKTSRLQRKTDEPAE